MTSFTLAFPVFVTFTFIWSTSCQKSKATQTCNFSFTSRGKNDTSSMSVQLHYSNEDSQCLECATGPNNAFKTLVKRERGRLNKPARGNRFCKMRCNGVLCYSKEENFSCHTAESIFRDESKEFRSCHSDKTATESSGRSKNQVPLIIGFAVGGVMLAVIIAGVYLGRSNKNISPRSSDVATTPVSMSYSEWISNYSTGGRGSKVMNHRVQEETESQYSQDAYQSGDVYNIVYDDNSLERFQGNPSGPTIIEVDEALGIDESLQEYSENYFQDSVEDPFSSVHEGTTLLYGGDQPVQTSHIMGQSVQTSHSMGQPAQTSHSMGQPAQTSHNMGQPAQTSYSMSQQVQTSLVTTAREEANNNNKGSKASQSCAGWPDCIEFATNSPTASNKRRSIGQWSDESEMERRHVHPLGSSCGSGFYRPGSGKTSRSSIKSTRRSKSLRHNYANMTHVFVDVHQNMTYSCDDLCSTGYDSMSYRRESDYLQTIASNQSMRCPDSWLKIEVDFHGENRKKSCDNFVSMEQIRTARRYSL